MYLKLFLQAEAKESVNDLTISHFVDFHVVSFLCHVACLERTNLEKEMNDKMEFYLNKQLNSLPVLLRRWPPIWSSFQQLHGQLRWLVNTTSFKCLLRGLCTYWSELVANEFLLNRVSHSIDEARIQPFCARRIWPSMRKNADLEFWNVIWCHLYVFLNKLRLSKR